MNYTIIRARRLELGKTQTDIAIACDVSVKAYINWETGANKPSFENMVKLKTALRGE